MGTRENLLDVSQVRIEQEDKKRPRIVLAQSGSPIVKEGKAKEGDVVADGTVLPNININYLEYDRIYFVNASSDPGAPLVETVRYQTNKDTKQIVWNNDIGKYTDKNNPRHSVSESYELYVLGNINGKYTPCVVSFRGTSIPTAKKILANASKGTLLFKLYSRIDTKGPHQYAVYQAEPVDINTIEEAEYQELISHKSEVQEWLTKFSQKQIASPSNTPTAIEDNTVKF